MQSPTISTTLLEEASPLPVSSLLKWPGGKGRELPQLLPLIPRFRRYYDPFVGGGAPFFRVQGEALINDASPELIALYRVVALGDPVFFQFLDQICQQWKLIGMFANSQAEELMALYKAIRHDLSAGASDVEMYISVQVQMLRNFVEPLGHGCPQDFLSEVLCSLLDKTARMQAMERRRGLLSNKDIVTNMECALKRAFYTYIRHWYNHPALYRIPANEAAAIFFFVREMAYASMFRYNQRGEFNVPYGGTSYNGKDLARKAVALRSPALRDHLARAVITNLDFEEFLHRYDPGPEDFILADPPYDSAFSTYAGHIFDADDHKRLAGYFKRSCRAKFLLVIKDSPTVRQVYADPLFLIRSFTTRYHASIQGRNERRAQHLIITNYV